MSKIRVKNFGPIKNGLIDNDGWIDIKKVTVFVGNQGSGKSTMAKLISTLMWIEKALVRGDFSDKDLTVSQFKKHCSYQNIGNYFKPNSSIEYHGKAFIISLKDDEVLVSKNEANGYSFPKIMYVPSERNFVSSVRNVNVLKGLPSTLYTFADEFFDAVQDLSGLVDLPINNAKIEYQKLNKLVWIIGTDYKIKLAEASSGFQSFVPLFIVSDYLANSLNRKENNSIKEISMEEEKRIRKEIEEILSNPKLSHEVKRASLEFLSSRFSYSSFINVVEEPEQNLFPTSQRKIMDSLLSITNRTLDNKLIMTTHSPYLINYLTLVVKANVLLNKITDKVLKSKLNDLVPVSAAIDINDLSIYELDELNGEISELKNYHGLPSDENELNDELEENNVIFSKMLEIQQQL